MARVSLGNYVQPPQWYASLPSVYVSACVLVTDANDHVLVVKPNYRPYWAIPGGIVEDGERPDECVAREVAEELGLSLIIGDLLVVDWSPPLGDRPKVMLNFTFDAGLIDDPDTIRLQHDELDDYAFLPWREAADRLPAATAPRIPAALRARKDHHAIYLPTHHD